MLRPGTKIHGVLSTLTACNSINRFEAAGKLNDYCLNYTISEIHGQLDIQLHRIRETVPCLGGAKAVDVMRYSLLPTEIKKAEKLLGHGYA